MPDQRYVINVLDEREPVGDSSFLSRPFLIAYGGFLVVMASLTFAIPSVQDFAMLVRWPALGVMSLLGLYQFLRSRCWELGKPRIALVGLIALAFASMSHASDPAYSGGRALSITLLFFATMLGVENYCRRRENAEAFADLWWVLGTAFLLGGILLRVKQGSTSGRYEGLHDRATGAGTFAALLLPIAIHHARFRFKGGFKVLAWGVVGLVFAQLILAGARTALLTSFFIAVLLWFSFYGKTAILGLLLAGLAFAIPPLIDARRAEAIRDRGERILRRESIVNFTGRRDRWKFGLEQFWRKPLLGHGFGASRTLASQEEPWRFRAEPGEVVNLHSDQIEVLADLGVLGYSAFACFWLAVLGAGARLFLQPGSPRRDLGLAYFGGVLYAFVDTFMHGGFLAAGGGVSAFTWTTAAAFLGVQACSEQVLAVIPKELEHGDGRLFSTHRRLRVNRATLPSARQVMG
ncbi:MAG: O-antigen ligase family protein [Planctomycetota bacterium]